MSYQRVLPRDAFNEANFLKCIGQLTMALEDGFFPFIQYEYYGGPFEMEQDINGCLYTTAIDFFYNGERLQVTRPLNSREPWPLYIETESGSVDIFNDIGEIVITEEKIKELM